MARTEHKTKLSVDDQASSKIERFGRNLDALGNRAERVGKKLTTIGAGMTAAITTPAIAGFMKLTNMASDLEESVNVVGITFGQEGQRILDFAANAENTGVSAAKMNQELSIMGLLMKNAGYSAEELTDKTLDLGKMAPDFASAMNKTVDEVLVAFKSGLTGETEALKGLGVDALDANLKILALKEGLIEEGEAMDQNVKKEAILLAIKKQHALIEGDFKNTIDQVANATRVATADFQNEAAALGQQLLPLKLELIQMLRDLVKWFSDLSPQTKDFILKAIGIAAVLGPVIFGIGAVILGIKGIAAAAVSLLANPALAGILIAITLIAMLAFVIVKNWTKVKYFLLEAALTIGHRFMQTWDS